MTMPEWEESIVTLKDGTKVHARTLVLGGSLQYEVVPHNPDVPSPIHVSMDQVQSIEPV